MSVNNYIKSSDSLNPIAGRTPDEKVDKTNVLSTLEEISASTNPLDVAGASALSELKNSFRYITPFMNVSYQGITGDTTKANIGTIDKIGIYIAFLTVITSGGAGNANADLYTELGIEGTPYVHSLRQTTVHGGSYTIPFIINNTKENAQLSLRLFPYNSNAMNYSCTLYLVKIS